ncbi:MAG: SpoIIE family protein phosphatase [Acidobacteria bacterium]|nr:SpoIIE family protein phosphatase [Acidobacteriota bacterium]
MNHERAITASPRVLVVDDNPDVLAALRLLLKSAAYQVETFAVPQAALEALRAQPFDLVLMDLNYARDTTSGQEGRALLADIRSHDAALPVVAMTAWGSIELAVELMQHGLNDFVQKPWDNARLLATLQQQLRVGEAKRQALRAAQEISEQQAREWAAARQMQERLLPHSLPVIAGYDIAASWQPMQAVGGDWYDVVQLDDDHLAFGIGDVTGKGLPAALLMANLQALVKAREAVNISPAQLCAEINQALCRNIEAGKFVTLFYGVLNFRSRKLSYCNAGHNPPLLVRADNSVISLPTGGALLGAFAEWVYEQGEVTLQAGDRLFCYTDGVTEAVNSAGDEFGEDGLLNWILQQVPMSASALPQNLLSVIDDYQSGLFTPGLFTPKLFIDDATVLVLAVSE